MTIAELVASSFADALAERKVTSDQILENPDPMMCDFGVPLSKVIPCYLQFCLDNPAHDSLVCLHTVNALAEYGRATKPNNDYLNFKYQCSESQKTTIAEFLRWSKGAPSFEDEDQVDRALRNWT